ncbi:MAG: alanine--tRNA ligase [SAR86 cluster bacterium]|uniref:Alanine--tRNA ligase n=1 Tax=SAR86 cluster bacterium TaxID=2030880 RepID=A0A2A5CC48_9GAMM|nr:alanine--tRNA ligase [Gammaproteobacteria bacterium AH-315-E17]PCJ41101.1 MAG: alanine--tRNA ligase [SAR86 cluster bacterium]
MNSAEIRQAFLDYFAEHGHAVVDSSSLVPANDPTLLFTNAGMVQFKDVFLGQDKRSYSRACSSQRCVRAGGKHNDLENVGYTARHHTFFEMLGNFSFGDYFKQDAIRFAWDFLTVNLGLSPEKLWVTVFHEDQAAEDIWLQEIGVSPERFSRLGEKDNFWAMGDTGPCGPCSEIFYDHGEDIPGGPPGSPDEDGDRYIEIWNLVFMQYNRSSNGELVDLPKPSVDTGMGLERISAILQGVHSNYEIDLFQSLLAAVVEVTGCNDRSSASLNVIADHIRACAFLVNDGVLPSNEGRGYVLRRIIRRAVRHGHQLGAKETFFYKLVAPLANVMGGAYPELIQNQASIETALKAEEVQFSRTLDNGMQELESAIAVLNGSTIPGETVFKLYDTFGFPVDLTADIARERNLLLDMDGFEEAMQAQKTRARAASRFEADAVLELKDNPQTTFTGYDQLSEESCEVIALYVDGKSVDSISSGQAATIVLSQTPFYAESGGQIGDNGTLYSQTANFVVKDTQKQSGQFLHQGELSEGEIVVGSVLKAAVDSDERQATVLNHSATHLMHAALRNILGDHVMQKGSLVNTDYLRFDFSHSQAVSPDELNQIETLVNQQILQNSDVSMQTMSVKEAQAQGAMALFGEKYGDEVRVISMGAANDKGFSIELCGGTHANRTGDIGLFKIIQESGIAAGVRRIEAVTGLNALELVRTQQERLRLIANLVKSDNANIEQKVEHLQKHNRDLEKQVEQLKAKLASSTGNDLTSQVSEIKGVKVLVAEIEGLNSKDLRDTCDQLKNKLGSAVILLAASTDGKVSLVAGVTKDLLDKVKAGDLVNAVAQHVGGKGGGRPDMAMAGGPQVENLDKALASVKPFLENIL